MKKHNLDQDIAENLARTYGVRAWEVCRVSDQHQRLAPELPYIEAEVAYACREYACTVEDILSRRTRMAVLRKEAALAVIPRVAAIMAKELGWRKAIQTKQIEAATKYINSYGGPTPTDKL